jgi:hypothetical protein
MVTVAVVLGVVATAIAVSAPAAADQTNIIERKVSCATEHGALQMDVFARIAGAASANIHTGDPNAMPPSILLAVDTRVKHYVLGDSCRRAAKRIALTHRGLTSAGVVHAGDYPSPAIFCGATKRVLLHFKLGFDAAGKPTIATVAVRTQPRAGHKSKPIGYVQWSPQRSVTYYSSRACTSQGG